MSRVLHAEQVSVAQVTRPNFLKFAHWLAASEDNFYEAYQVTSQAVDRNTLMLMQQWAVWGAQSVVMPDTYAAALMASDVHGALEGQDLPWPAFEICVPPKVLYSSHGEVTRVFVTKIPAYATRIGKYQHHTLSFGYLDGQSWGVNTFESLVGMFSAEEQARVGQGLDHVNLTPELESLYSGDQEQRLWAMITRLVAGVVLAIAGARSEKRDAFPLRAGREKHGAMRPNTAQLGHPLRIDCRASVRDFVRGETTRGPQNVQVLVRGHWRNQAYGPKWSQHRERWILPFYRGEGPQVVRPTKLGFGKERPHE